MTNEEMIAESLLQDDNELFFYDSTQSNVEIDYTVQS